MSSKTYLSIFIIFLSCLFLYFFVYEKYQELSFLKQKLSQKEEELGNTKRYIRQLKEAAEKLKKYSNELSIIDTAFPEKLQQPETFYLLQTLCTQSGATLKSFEKITASGDNLPKRWQTQITVLADYQTFKNFLSNLEKSARMIKVVKISFEAGEKSEELYNFNLALVFNTY